MAENVKKGKTFVAVLLMLGAAIIWGTSFVAQSEGLNKIGNFTFLTFRSYLAVAALLPVSFIFYKSGKKREGDGLHGEYKTFFSKKLITGGVLCGIALCAAAALQQRGIYLAGVGKSGFLTTLYMLIVPLIGLIVFKQKVAPTLWACIAVALVGMYCLCTEDANADPMGYVCLVLCALGYSIQITIVDRYISVVDGIRLSLIQFITCSVISTVIMLFTETVEPAVLLDCWFEVFYAGVMSSGAAFTLQIISQKNLNPVVATLLMSLESVIAAISGALILHEEFQGTKLLGCVLVFVAVIISQLPLETWIKNKKKA